MLFNPVFMTHSVRHSPTYESGFARTYELTQTQYGTLFPRMSTSVQIKNFSSEEKFSLEKGHLIKEALIKFLHFTHICIDINV